MTTITITPELHEVILTAVDMVSDAISMTDLARFPYMAESLGDVRDLLLILASGNLENLGIESNLDEASCVPES